MKTSIPFLALCMSLLLTLATFAGDPAVAPVQGVTTPAPLAADASAEKSLLPDGQFDKIASEEWPKGWTHPDGASWQKEADGHYIQLVSTKPGQTVLMYREIKLPDPLPPAMELRIKVRYIDIKPGEKKWYDVGSWAISRTRTARSSTPIRPRPVFRGSENQWVVKSVFFKVPSKATTLALMPCIFQAESGTLEFSRIELFPATLDQLPQTAADRAVGKNDAGPHLLPPARTARGRKPDRHP